MQGLLPLFPLPLVLLPGTPLPLHIFEPRYKEMIGNAIRDHTEFGVVLAREENLAHVGCTAAIDQVVTRYPDGRFDILASGRRRFEIVLLNEEQAYLQGEVQFFDDDEPGPAPSELTGRALASFRLLAEAEDLTEPEQDAPALSFQLGQPVEDLEFRQSLLELRSEPERMKRVADFLDSWVPKRCLAARMRRVARLNGRGVFPFSAAELP